MWVRQNISFGWSHRYSKSYLLRVIRNWWCFQCCHKHISAWWGHADYKPCNCQGRSGTGPDGYSQGFVAANKQPKFRLAQSPCSKRTFLLLMKCPQLPLPCCLPERCRASNEGSTGLGCKGPMGDHNLGSLPRRGPGGWIYLTSLWKEKMLIWNKSKEAKQDKMHWAPLEPKQNTFSQLSLLVESQLQGSQGRL